MNRFMTTNEEIKELISRLYYCSDSKEGRKAREWIERKIKTLEKQQHKGKKMTKPITDQELRKKVNVMTKSEMITLRDELENNWSESLRPLMEVLSLGCINNFGTTLDRLERVEESRGRDLNGRNPEIDSRGL